MPWRHAVLLLLAIVAVFGPALGGDYVYDDLQLVVRNPALQGNDLAALLGQPLWGDEHGYWRPLTSLSLWLGNGLGGAAGVHALALLLHGGNALLAFGLARRLFGDDGRALATALWFAVHPVQVEAVAWCAAINDPLWACCVLLAVRAAVRWRDAGSRGTPWAAGVCGLLALLAKENAIAALPLVVAGAVWLPARHGAPTPRLPPWPLMRALGAAVAIWLLLRALVFGSVAAGLWREPDGAPVATLRLLTAPFELLVRHWALLLWPWPGTPFRALPAAAHALQATLAVALVAGLLAGCWRARRGLGTAPKFALLLLLLPLLPTLLGWRSVGSYAIGERYLYLAVFGASLWLVHAVGTGRLRWLPWALAAAAAPLSFAQTWHWRNQATLVAHGLSISPDDPNLRVMSGDVHLPTDPVRASADYAAAERLAGTAAAERPHRALAAARLGLAWSLFQQQRGQRGPGTGQLVAAFQRAIDTDPERPAAWVGLGAAFGVAGRTGDAENAFRRALALDPDHPEAWFNLGFLQAQMGRSDDARASLQQALRCNPQNGQARQLLQQLR